MELEQNGEIVKLTISHALDGEGTKFIKGVSNGWPKILSSLKSFLETGRALESS
jgi:hypothetical protein